MTDHDGTNDRDGANGRDGANDNRSGEAGTRPGDVLPSKREHDELESEHLDPDGVLERLEALDIRQWTHAAGARSGVEHLGPSAEDFYEAFEFGENPDSTTPDDADGVALAAIQGLSARLEEQRERLERQDRRIEAQSETIAEQRRTIDAQRDDLESLRSTVESIVTGIDGLRRAVRETRQR